ncbi:response regulator [Blautia schinkii]|nr:response regulator [Blautia schinkii]
MKKRVLIVEDDKFFRFAVKKMIDWDKYGFEIAGEAVHGEAALAFLSQNEAEVVITDMSMPIMNGIELTAALKEKYPHILVIALSAYDDFEFVKESLKLGAQDYILKQDIENQDVGEIIWKSWEKHRQNLARDHKIKAGLRQILLKGKDDERAQRYLRISLMDQWGFYLCRIENLNEEWNAPKCREEVWIPDSLVELHGQSEHLLLLPVQKDHSLKNQAQHRDRQLKEIQELLEGEEYLGGCSSQAESIDKLSQLRTEVHGCLEMSRFLKRKQILVWDLVKDQYEKRTKDYVADKADFGFVSEREQAKRALNDLTAKLRVEMPEECCIQRSYLNFIDAVARNLHMEMDNQQYANLKEMLERSAALDQKHEICLTFVEKMFLNTMENVMHPGVRVAISYMKKNYEKDLALIDIADSAALNESYFSGLFKKDTGRSITEYLNEIRIYRAKELISETNYKNYEIAEMVGIPNSSYFSTVFKKQTGMTIQEYRQIVSLKK